MPIPPITATNRPFGGGSPPPDFKPPERAPTIFTRQDALDGLAKGYQPQQIRDIVAANGDEMSGLADDLLREREGGGTPAAAGAPSAGGLAGQIQTPLGAMYPQEIPSWLGNIMFPSGGGEGRAAPTQGISLSEALAIQESERAKGNVVQIATHTSGIGYDVSFTSTPAPARTGFATPEEAYAATPGGLALGQLTGTPTTGFMPTYINQAPSPFEEQQFQATQEQNAINNEIQRSTQRLNVYINIGNQQLAAQEANYKSRLEIRAQALMERTSQVNPMLEMGRSTGRFPARAIMEAAGRALPEMPRPLDVQVPSSEAVLAAAGIPLAARPPVARPGASATIPPAGIMARDELAARLLRGMR